MFALVFGVGEGFYAIDARRVVEVVPRIELRPLPRVPDQVVGVFEHIGRLVPVVDLGVLLLGRPCESRLSTRIVLVDVLEASGTIVRLGLVAERVQQLLDAPDVESDPAARSADAPYLGVITRLGGELTQMIDVDRILPEWLLTEIYHGWLRAG